MRFAWRQVSNCGSCRSTWPRLARRPRPDSSEVRAEDHADISAWSDAVVSHWRAVAEVVHTRRVPRVEDVVRHDAELVARARGIARHAGADVRESVAALLTVGREKLLEVVLRPIRVIAEEVHGVARHERPLIVEPDDAGPARRADDLLAGVIADRDG